MNQYFSLYRKYNNLELAKETEAYFNANGIETRLGDNIAPVDVTFSTGKSVLDQIEVRIKTTDFEKADALLEKLAQKQFSNLDPEYYLFSYSDEELYEIIVKPDEWNIFDYTLAQKILSDRDKPIDKALLVSLKKQRLNELSKPEENQKAWINVGYILALLGGFFGIVIGYMLWTQKKTLPNGNKVYSHKESDRKHGRRIVIIGVTIIIITLLIQLNFFIDLFN